jgi:hypothetical protein
MTAVIMIARSRSGRLLAFDALELQHDPQRGRDFGHVLLSFGCTLEQTGELAPCELGPVLGRQMLLDKYPHSASVSRVSTSGMVSGPRQWARPDWSWRGRISRNTEGLWG